MRPAARVVPATNTPATVGMIFGIITAAISWTAFFILPLILPLGTGITGLIVSILGLQKAKANGVGAGKAKAGLILSIVGLAIAILFLIWGVMAWMEMSRWAGDMWEQAKPPEVDPSTL
jgi:hypothetical protein